MLPDRIRLYLLSDLECAPDVLSRLISGITDHALYDRRPDAARFTLREMVAHLADWEVVFSTRLTQTRDESDPILLGQDESQLAIDHDYAHADPQESLNRYATGRAKSVTFLRCLTEPEWQRSGRHTDIGPMTLLEQLIMIVAHDGYHRQQTIDWLSS